MAEASEWTVMFFFAGDNALSPLIVSQIKDIKDAGFQKDTNVLTYFDSNEKGAPTRIYEVNRGRKGNPRLPKTVIGDGNDPFVRDMRDDNVDPESIDPDAGPASAAMRKSLLEPDSVNARDALENFVGFCRERYRANHYLLFLVGHGVIVGNDAFLPDENPDTAITLIELEGILRCFARRVGEDGGSFDLLALHSCSMSGVEVAYQIKGTAKYMMASEGISYVGSWPYRHLLIKLFNSVEGTKQEARRRAQEKGEDPDRAEAAASPDVPSLVEKLYFLTMFNAVDYMLSGYSLELSLCDLSEEKMAALRGAVQALSAALKQALGDVRGRELIQLAHLQSQSYWQENYTDLYDFCLCIGRNCDEGVGPQRSIKQACDGIVGMLETDKEDPFRPLVVHSENFGSKYQYSHGLSIYFPWCEPTDDAPPVRGAAAQNDGGQKGSVSRGVLNNYRRYAFTSEFGDDSWLSFLEAYFEGTKRRSRAEEGGGGGLIDQDVVLEFFDPFGALGGPGPVKPTPSTGQDCGCPSIKNYPTQLVKVDDRTLRVRAVSVSGGLADAFTGALK